MGTFIGVLAVLFMIGWPIFMIVDLIKKHKQGHKIGKRLGIELGFGIVMFFILAVWAGNLTSGGDNSASSHTKSAKVVKKKPASQNIPGQRINPSKATKHKFYWTANSDNHIRYFADNTDHNKITAIKYKYDVDEQYSTTTSQAKIDDILHDSNLRYGNDKQKEDNTLLSNNKAYNLYSPARKKWYWVQFVPGLKKDAVCSFSIYPGKSSEAE